MQDLFRHLRIHTSTKRENLKMMWFWLKLSRFFNKIGNYFYYRHVNSLRFKQRLQTKKVAKK